MVRMFRRLLPFAALICAVPVPMSGQSSSGALQSRLRNKPLYLRGFWQEDGLHFDSAGNLIGRSRTLPFTLCGIEITVVDLKSKSLLLEGRRVGLQFDKDTPQRIVLVTGSPHSGFDEEVRIEIDAPPNGDYGPALDAIFTDDLASFIPSLRFAWQFYATRHFLHGSPTPNLKPEQPIAPAPDPKADQPTAPLPAPAPDPKPEQPAAPPAAKSTEGKVLPPRLIKSVPPEFNEYARINRMGGTCLINLVVDKEGRPSRVKILRPIGFGLDEQALRAVEQYVFTPATMDGQPVAVELNIVVKFDAF
jgi:TonB family protein